VCAWVRHVLKKGAGFGKTRNRSDREMGKKVRSAQYAVRRGRRETRRREKRRRETGETETGDGRRETGETETGESPVGADSISALEA